MKCEKCEKEHDGSFGSGRFCSISCANRNIPTDECKLKISKKLTGKPSIKKDPELWKKNLSLAHDKRRKEKYEKILSKNFNELNLSDKRLFVLKEQGEKCLCGLNEWKGQSLTLELDHIDGNPNNNLRENLRFLCPNCHSQTPTWRKKSSNEKVNDNEFIQSLRESESIYEAIMKLKLRPNGGAYRRARRLIKENKLTMKVDL